MIHSHGLRAASKSPMTLEYLASGGSVADNTSYSFTGVNLGAAGASREIFVVINWSNNNARNLASASIGGVAATIATTQASSVAAGGAACFFATVPTGTTGTISITMNNGVTRLDYGVYRVTNRKSIGGNQTSQDGNASSTQASPQTSTALTVNSGGWAIGGWYCSPAATPITSSLFTVDATNDAASSETNRQYLLSYRNFSASNLTPTQTVTWSTGAIALRWQYWAFNP